MRKAGKLPSQFKQPRTWRTRENPFEDDWDWVVEQLQRHPALQGATLFALLGAKHPDTASSLNNLAVLYKSQGKYAEAEPLYERALEIRERVLGAEHPDTTTSLNNLAVLYKSQGKYREAEPLFERAAGHL
jgi:tetratricopeptide (TPR) repeat protein